jgi:hypothetical protein
MRNDALRVVSMLAASSNNVFTRTQAASAGLDRRQVRRLIDTDVLHEPWPGVLIALPPGGVPTWLQLCTGSTRKGGVASHRAAGRLHRLDGLESCDLIETSAEGGTPRLAGVVQHHASSLPRCDLVTVQGVHCTGIARTLTDLGSVASIETVERAFDDAVRRGTNPRWLRETAERLRRPGVAGPLVLLSLVDAFERRGTVRGSWFERLLELALQHPELDDLVIQHRLERSDGTHVATFDLALPDAKLAIEAHSRTHHFTEADESSDEFRDHEASVLAIDIPCMDELAAAGAGAPNGARPCPNPTGVARGTKFVVTEPHRYRHDELRPSPRAIGALGRCWS